MRNGCIWALSMGCAATPIDETVLPTPTLPIVDERAPCPHPDPPFRFEGLQRPIFATPPSETMTRTYSGRVLLPEITTTDLTSVWVHGVAASVDPVVLQGAQRSVRFTALAPCDDCRFMHVHLGGPEAPPVLTAPTPLTGDVDERVSLETTARMALALSTAEGGAARVEPATRQLRPDLNSVVGDMEDRLLEGLILGVGTGVTETAQPIPDQGLVAASDLYLSDGSPGPGTTNARRSRPASCRNTSRPASSRSKLVFRYG